MEWRWIKISHTCPSRMPLQSLTMWLRIRTRTRRWLCSCCETTWPSGLPTRKPEIETRQIAGMSAATTAVAESWLGPHTVLGDGGNPHRNWWAERWKRIRGCTCWRVTAPEKPRNSRPKRPEPTECKLAERTSHHHSQCSMKNYENLWLLRYPSDLCPWNRLLQPPFCHASIRAQAQTKSQTEAESEFDAVSRVCGVFGCFWSVLITSRIILVLISLVYNGLQWFTYNGLPADTSSVRR